MKYKYNIAYKDQGKSAKINFNSKRYMIDYLNKNIDKLDKLHRPVINFGQISLPIKTTIWCSKND